jgi:hypothetical protein
MIVQSAEDKVDCWISILGRDSEILVSINMSKIFCGRLSLLLNGYRD